MKMPTAPMLIVPLLLAPALVLAQAQATVKPDGQFRYALGAGASYASGNTDAASVNVTGDAVRSTADSKFEFTGKALWSRSNGQRTADNAALGTQYDQDFTPQWFGLAKADVLRDELANLSSRSSVFGGAGRHIVKSDPLTFDLSAGLVYTRDRYVESTVVLGQERSSYGRLEALLAEESSHKFTSTTNFHQKLSLYPALRGGGGYRAVFDTGLSVAMTPLLSLTVA